MQPRCDGQNKYILAQNLKWTKRIRRKLQCLYLKGAWRVLHNSSLILMKHQKVKISQNRMKSELIRILFVTSLDKGRQTDVSVKKIHGSWKLNGNIFVKLFLWDLDEKNDLGRLQKKTKQKKARQCEDPIIYSVSPWTTKQIRALASSTIDKETVILSVLTKQSWRTLKCRIVGENHKVKPKKLLCQIEAETNGVNLWTQQI